MRVTEIRRLDLLVPEFLAPLTRAIERTKDRGFDVRPVGTLRTPWEQARLWRSSRSGTEIREKIAYLRVLNLGYLADILEVVGPQPTGKWKTNAIPGMGWHSWGQACDFGVFEGGVDSHGGRYIDDDPDHPGYVAIAEESRAEGLTAGRYWKKHPDPPHVQLSMVDSPASIYSMSKVQVVMREMYGTDEHAWLVKNGFA